MLWVFIRNTLPRCSLVNTTTCLHGEMASVVQLDVHLTSDQGPVVQSVVSLTSSLRVISLTVLVDSIHSILIFFAEKM